MTVTISPETEKLVRQQMKDRGYDSVDALIAAAVEQLAQDKLDVPPDVLNALLDKGQRELAAGLGIPAEQVFQELESARRRRSEDRPT